MWLITPFGFFSVVQKPDDDAADTLTVRARVKDDLDTLRSSLLPALGPTAESKSTDYRYRAKAPRAAVAAAMASMVEQLKYSNFKNEVAKKQGTARAHLYHDVWDVLYRMQGNPKYGKPEAPNRKHVDHAAQVVPPGNAYGGVVLNELGQVLLREPKGHYGDYVWTFPKGRPDKGESPADAAQREVREETGYETEILAPIPQAFPGTTTKTSFFLMKAVGLQGDFSEETEQTRWVGFDEAVKLISLTKTQIGKKRDLAVLDAATALCKSMALLRSSAIQVDA